MYTAEINLQHKKEWYNSWNSKEGKFKRKFRAPGIKQARKVLKTLKRTKGFNFKAHIKNKILCIKEVETNGGDKQ